MSQFNLDAISNFKIDIALGHGFEKKYKYLMQNL